MPLPETGASASAEKTWRHKLTIIIPHVLSRPQARDTIIARDKMAIIMRDESEIKQVSPLTLVQYLPTGRQALGTQRQRGAPVMAHFVTLNHFQSEFQSLFLGENIAGNVIPRLRDTHPTH